MWQNKKEKQNLGTFWIKKFAEDLFNKKYSKITYFRNVSNLVDYTILVLAFQTD